MTWRASPSIYCSANEGYHRVSANPLLWLPNAT